MPKVTENRIIDSSALPAGAATSGNQTTANASLSSMDGKLTVIAGYLDGLEGFTDGLESLLSAIDGHVDGLETKADAGNSSLSSIDTKLTSQATGAKQDTGNASLSSIDTKLTSQATGAKQDTIITSLQLIDDAIHAPNGAISKVVAIGGQMDDAGITDATENNVSAARITAKRALHVNLRTDAGAEIGTAASPVRTDPTGSTAQPVTLAALPALVAGAAIIGKVGIDQSTPGTTNGVQVVAALPAGANAIGKLAANAGVTIGAVEFAAAQTIGAVTSITNALPAGTNRLGSVRPVDSADADLTSAKGSQTARAIGVQQLKDGGRTMIQLFATGAASGSTGVETLITLTKSSAFGATSSGTDYTITNGKRFRITSITFASRGHVTATVQITTFTLRINAGAVAAGSTAFFSARTATPATSLAWDRFQMPVPDGLELLGDGTNRIGVSANAVFTTNAPTWDVCITGYEY